MTLPLVLVVDDQFARDADEREWFVRHTQVTENFAVRSRPSPPWARVAFCSGQTQQDAQVRNEVDVVRAAVDERLTELALVLVDARFDSGEVENGSPVGQQGDDLFGIELWQLLQEEFPSLPVLMLTGKPQNELGDVSGPYLSKKNLNERIFRQKLLHHGRLTVQQKRHLLQLPDWVIAESDAMLGVFTEAFSLVDAEAPILLLGETGVGKEAVAKYLHETSRRKGGPLVSLNTAAIPRELLESELFGHVKGAFTGASSEKRGRFEAAQGGSFFLDEIGDMPMDAQAKVLRAIQEKEIERIGGLKSIPIDCRFTSATSRDLAILVREGRFREDLYYRLAKPALRIPPLRERRDDILPLVEAHLSKASRALGKEGLSLTREAKEALFSYHFPGNVRELQSLAEFLAASAGSHETVSEASVLTAIRGVSLGNRSGSHSPAARLATETEILPPPASLHPSLGLGSLLSSFYICEVRPEELKGSYVRAEFAYAILMRRLVISALERTRNPNSGILNLQGAMRLISGNSSLQGKASKQLLNKMLRRYSDADAGPEFLEALVRSEGEIES
jgi:DNA-binding NtrC family response regulator